MQLSWLHILKPNNSYYQLVCIINVVYYCSHYQYAIDYFTDNILAHFTASMISGLVTTIASLPVDITKTRLKHDLQSYMCHCSVTGFKI